MPSVSAPSLASIPRFSPPESTSCDARFMAQPTTAFVKAYRRFGPVFRVNLWGEERVALGGLEANKFVWGDPTLWNYRETNRIFREQFSDRYLNQLEGDAYRQKRRRVNQGFKPRMLFAHSAAMAQALHAKVADAFSTPVDLRQFCMELVIAMTAKVLLQTDLPPGMDTQMAISNKEMLKASSLGWKRWLWYAYPPKVARRRKIFGYLGKVLDARAANPPVDDDILSFILAAHPADAPPIPRPELVHDLSQLFMAGSTTSSMIICWALLETYSHPAWLSELRAEIGDWKAGEFRSLEAYPKLRATVLEVERLRPGVPVFNRIAARDFEFGGHRVPKGTPVLHLHTLCHVLSEHYLRPLTFDPGRFLRDPELPARGVHGTYGGGAHQCVGQPLARLQPPLVVAEVVSKFDLLLKPAPSLKDRYDVVTAPLEPLIQAQFIPRRS